MKKLFIALGVLVLLLVGVVVVAPFLVPLDTYKAEAIARVKAATGRDLRIDGPIRFSILPVLGIEASKVSFSNAPGASTPEMLQLGKVEVALKAMPLLSGEIAIDRFVLTDPVIQLEIDKQGRPNWVFGDKSAAPPAGAAGAAPAQPKPAGAGARGLSELRLDDIRLVNGRVTWLDQRSGAKQELTDIAMKLALPSLEDALAAEGAVTWRGKPVRTVLNVAKPRALIDGGTSGVAMKVTSEPVNFEYQGQVTNAAPLKVEGAIDLKVPSVRGLGAWVGSPVPGTGGPGTGSTFGPLDIKGKLAMAGSRIGFNEATVAFDAIRGKGELAVDGGGAKPHLQARLELEKLDMNPYLPAEKPAAAAAPAPAAGAPAPAGAPAAAPAPARAAGWSDDPIDLSGLRAADADLSLTVGGLQVRRIQVGASALAVTLKDGRMTADLSRLALYQGNGSGRLALDGSGPVPGVDLAFKLSGLQAEPALRDATGFDQITGTGNFDIAANGRGKSQRELVGALNGRGDLRFANGTLKGINLGAIAQAGRSLVSGNPAGLIQGIEGALKGGTGANQQTEFSSLTGSFVIASGILKNSDLDLKSPVLHATGSGSADLPRRTADYRVVVAADTLQVPVLISGPWDNLSYKPDTQALMTQGGGQAIQNLINKAAPGVLPNAGGNKGAVPGDLLKGLFRNR